MKVKAEIYGETVGIDGGLSRLIAKKEGRVLLCFSDDKNKTRSEFVLSKEEATSLIAQIRQQINHAESNGFTII